MTIELIATAETWAAAERRNDPAALEDLLTDDFAALGPRGFQLDKEQWLQRFRAGGYLNTRLDWQDLQISDYGETAIVRGVQTSEGSYEGQKVGGQFRGTQVYVKQDGAWKLAAMQLSEMAAPMAGSPPQ